ncbi:filamin-C-like isoform X2 [Gigantopelta aegis]|uniref:filamin-C-like isoform X2 n=1 Tax=Gigantopelta aegis TaxID=1735272 RepID=UPI001B8887DF|nr:filamin-C-like isoform X2 [Gigantopelta aegis]
MMQNHVKVYTQGNSLKYTDNVSWLQIQRNTFTNWLNEQLKAVGVVIQDLRTDFADGVNLIRLVETLQGRNVGAIVRKPQNQYEKFQNITVALDAIRADGVRIVNIDSTDITQGDIKLVLALVWQLILRYQVGLSAVQHRAWFLKWLQAVIPECNIKNFTTDWNDGTALYALLDFCKAGLGANWRQRDRGDKLNNCRDAMKVARQHFGIPLVLRPEDLASPQLDERSAITYLSYFIKVDGPGYVATLEKLQYRLRNRSVRNFTTDWHDGRALCELVYTSGVNIPGWPELEGTPLQNLQLGVEGAKQIGIEPLLTPEEISEETNEHLGIMAYTAQFLKHAQSIPAARNVMYNVPHRIDVHDRHDVTQYVIQHGRPDTAQDVIPKKVTVHNSDRYSEHVSSMNSVHTSSITSPSQSPSFHLVKKTPDVQPQHMARLELPAAESYKVDVYSVGVIIETKMNGDFDPEMVLVEAEAPSGRIIKITGAGHYSAQFMPNEIGQWKVSVYYDGRYLDGCPIDVADPSQVRVCELSGGMMGRHQNFKVDCTKAGTGDVEVDITHKGRKIPVYLSQPAKGFYKVSYTPHDPGPYAVNVKFNKAEIRDCDLHNIDPEERQRKAVFNTSMVQEDGQIKVKASCDWEIDYLTGGPFICHVTDASDIQVYVMQDGTICSSPQLIADCTRVGDGVLEAEVTYNGLQYPTKIVQDKPCVYRITFKPRGPGVYKVYITYDGTQVKGSPFIQEIDELKSPQAHGEGLKRAILDEPTHFFVDPRGFPGTVSVNVTGPTYPIKSQIEPLPDGTLKVHYTPVERGRHIINIRIDGRDIEDSPFMPTVVDPYNVRVSGGWRPLVDDKGIIPLVVNKEKQLPFDASAAGPGELTAQVRGPSGKIPVAIDARNDGRNTVIFTPREEGRHTIDVRWSGFPLEKSPYIGYATRYPEVEPDNYKLVQIPLKTDSYPRQMEAYPRQMEAYPRQADTYPRQADTYPRQADTYPRQTEAYPRVTDTFPRQTEAYPRKTDAPRQTVVYQYQSDPYQRQDDPYPRPPSTVGSLNGEPQVSIHGSEPAIYRPYQAQQGPNVIFEHPQETPPPSMPNAVKVLPTLDARRSPKVILSGRGLKEAEVDKPAVFYVDGTKAGVGFPAAELSSINDKVPVNIEPVRPQVSKCTYIPRKPGAYLLNLKWNHHTLKGSPFKVNVRVPARPMKVKMTMPPTHAVVGKDLEINIDPREGGPGELRVKCTGPHGQSVPCTLYDNYDGTRRLKIKPTEIGHHVVEITYCGEHIHGSPYAIDIKASHVVGDVKVWGPGIENGIIPGFQSHFWVDATGAGAGELRVRIMGPKGAFKVKMRKTSQKDKVYQCFYDPIESGIYTIYVQWSGTHVDGSPYTVLLANSSRELDMMNEDHTSSLHSKQHSPRDFARGHTSSTSPQHHSNSEFLY